MLRNVACVRRSVWTVLLCALGVAPDTDAQALRPRVSMPMVERNLVESLASKPELSTFTHLVRRAGLTDTLRAWGPFTIFAPTNDAFTRVPAATLDRYRRDRARLRTLVLRHVLVGSAFQHHILALTNAIMVSGDTIAVQRTRRSVRLDGQATVAAWTLRASNGAIHTVDRVMLPRRSPRRPELAGQDPTVRR